MMNWIWNLNKDRGCFEFKGSFYCDKADGNIFLRISADYKYYALVNGKMISNGQMADLPKRKIFNITEISDAVVNGQNELLIYAAHSGQDYAQCRAMDAAIAFTVYSANKILLESDENILSRESQFVSIADYMLTGQLGVAYSYNFDNKGKDWEKSRIKNVDFKCIDRPIKNLVISKDFVENIVAQGSYKYNGGSTPGEEMELAYLSAIRFHNLTSLPRSSHGDLHTCVPFSCKDGDGIYVVVDLGKETCGHLSFEIDVKKSCKMYIGWGEHLVDLRPRTFCDGRNFAETFILKSGKNDFTEYFMRIGCRYVCAFVETDEFVLSRLTVYDVTYPFKNIERDFGDRYLNKLYNLSKRTLQLCAHEHYEDCPWREQGLYGMDSRHQMLFGYGAFEEYDYARENLRLLAYSSRSDGLVQLCAPARSPFTIPSFSAYWMLAVCENALVDYNEDFVKEMLPFCEKCFMQFEKRTDENGITVFVEPEYWNFHDWSAGLEGGDFNRTYEIAPSKDGILTCVMSVVAYKLAEIEEKILNKEKAEFYRNYSSKLKDSIEKFYDKEKGMYAAYINNGERTVWHQYMQAVAVWAGAVEEDRKKRIAYILKNKVDAITAMTFNIIKYESIMKLDGDLDFCINEICDVYGSMMESGATSLWETAYGESDFCDAGSLCHGWSGLACWFFNKYLG